MPKKRGYSHPLGIVAEWKQQNDKSEMRLYIMITPTEVKQIVSKLPLQHPSISGDSFIDDIKCIVYHNHVFECGNKAIINRHVDIEFFFGEYYEICETTSLFQFICELCKFPLLNVEQEIILYQK